MLTSLPSTGKSNPSAYPLGVPPFNMFPILNVIETIYRKYLFVSISLYACI